MRAWFFNIALFIVLSRCSGTDRETAEQYFTKYGYGGLDFLSDEEFMQFLKKFQRFAGLHATGILDKETLQLMKLPRCSMRDPIEQDYWDKSYLLHRTSWKKNLLTWHLQGKVKNSTRIKKFISEATGLWSNETGLKFKETGDENADIVVKFVKRYHRDAYAFDGPGGALGHAFYPMNGKNRAGDVHLDAEEKFWEGSHKDQLFLKVLVHEIGHAIGLMHSHKNDSVMNPWFQKGTAGVTLSSGDIQGAQSLYGKPPTTPNIVKASVRKPFRRLVPRGHKISPRQTPFLNISVSAMYFNKHDRTQYVITKNGRILTMTAEDKLTRNRQTVSEMFPGLDRNIDAAVTLENLNHAAAFFVGRQYYIYHNRIKISGPHSIHESDGPLKLNLPEWVYKVDAALSYCNNKIYVFAGLLYWRFDNNLSKQDFGYPKLIKTHWKGLPARVDAAYSSKADRTVYFVAGTEFYDFDPLYAQVKTGYPITTAKQWKIMEKE